MTFIGEVAAAIREAEAQGRSVTLEGVTGLSGDKLLGLLQRCARLCARNTGSAYVEVGVFQGLTLTSVAAAAPRLRCLGIDDFSQFDADGRNRSIVEQRLGRHTDGNGTLINADFEQALLGLGEHLGDRKVGIYFVDGPHDYRSQYLCLDFARPHLADEVVIVVDDSNYEHVRRANADWLKANPEFALLFEAYTPAHPINLAGNALQRARAGWWNGINVIVRDRANTLSRTYPPVDDSRTRYFNDHLVHPARYAEEAPHVLGLLARPFPIAMLKIVQVLFRRGRFRDRFRSMNTYSAALPEQRMAPFKDQAVQWRSNGGA